MNRRRKKDHYGSIPIITTLSRSIPHQTSNSISTSAYSEFRPKDPILSQGYILDPSNAISGTTYQIPLTDQETPSVPLLFIHQQVDNSIIQVDNSIIQADNSVIQADNSVIQADNSIIQADNSIIQADNSIIQVDNSLAQVDNSVIQVDYPVIQVDNPTAQVDNSIPQVDNSIPQVDNSITQADNSITQVDDLITQVDNSITQADNSTIQVDNSIIQVDNPIIQADNSTIQADNSTIQVDNSIIQVDNPIIQVNKSMTQVDKSMTQYDSTTQTNYQLFMGLQERIEQLQMQMIEMRDSIISRDRICELHKRMDNIQEQLINSQLVITPRIHSSKSRPLIKFKKFDDDLNTGSLIRYHINGDRGWQHIHGYNRSTDVNPIQILGRSTLHFICISCFKNIPEGYIYICKNITSRDVLDIESTISMISIHEDILAPINITIMPGETVCNISWINSQSSDLERNDTISIYADNIAGCDIDLYIRYT
jgi:hypothetical protein